MYICTTSLGEISMQSTNPQKIIKTKARANNPLTTRSVYLNINILKWKTFYILSIYCEYC